jgi:hypothetical protein
MDKNGILDIRGVLIMETRTKDQISKANRKESKKKKNKDRRRLHRVKHN